MDVITFVVAATGPERTAIERGHVRPLCIGLRQTHRAVVFIEREALVVAVVQRDHAIDAEYRAIVEGVQILAQLKLAVLLAFVAQAVFGLRPRQLETRLATALGRVANATAQVTTELQRC